MKLAANTRVNMRVEQKPSGILPMNHSNKDGKPSAESEEGRLLIKENTLSSSTHPTQSGSACSTGESVRTRFMLGRYSSAIRAACANERSCGSVRGAISNDRSYRDLVDPLVSESGTPSGLRRERSPYEPTMAL